MRKSGAQQEDGGSGERGAEAAGLGDICDPEHGGVSLECGCHLVHAMAIGVGLHDGHDLRAGADVATDGSGVVSQGVVIDLSPETVRLRGGMRGGHGTDLRLKGLMRELAPISPD